ncbi:aspartate kinase [Maribellus maritimus]|uniref:aspartate kinase n=1 Tax=Maribellus maritimus TaxID=2870838 RepID=UPI001EEA6601|nr:aspartate kinase [Maribellus maritimus]MCG6190796.1 aspartate kinase [Maribellus maritimus]
MSNRVIRLGGSNIGDIQSVNNLSAYLGRSGGVKLVVVSAIPELLQFVRGNIENVFSRELDTTGIITYLNEVYSSRLNSEPSAGYKNLSEQLLSLLKGIALIGDYSRALKDQVISYAEKLSVEILQNQWKEVKVVYPEEIALLTSPDFGNATFISVDKPFFFNLQDGVYVIPGSYGITENGKTARTGKTAADYTAAFLTAYLGVEKLELWSLDNDFQKADPNIVPNPPKIARLTYSEASELAYFQHYSFHPRTVEPLEDLRIPIYVLNSSSDEAWVETKINTETFVDDKIVKSVACTDDISLLKLDGPGVGLKPGILAKVTTCLNEAGINIKSVITSQISINLILERKTGEKALSLIEHLGFNSVQETTLVKDVSLIGIIGHGMQQNYGVSARIFNAVAQHKINVVLSGSGASDLVSYLVVKSSDKEKSVREIYNAFFTN